MKKDNKICQFVFVCHGKDCTKKGAKEIHQVLERELKLQGLKSSSKVVKTKCLDRCKDAPSVVYNNSWHGRVKAKDIKQLLEVDKNKLHPAT